MVLQELGSRITKALQCMSNATIVDEKVLTECLNEISRALLEADVQIKMVATLQGHIKKSVNLNELASGLNKRKIIQQAIYTSLCNMFDFGELGFIPQKNKTNIIMFVGLQGAGKTTSCTKFAHYYRKKGLKSALICGDTFRAGAFDQLKQNATKANIPFYGSYTESDPLKIIQEGINKFAEAGHNLIIIDTSGRHKQELSLFEEMRQFVEVIMPDQVVFVMDSNIGQTAFDHAKAFKDCTNVGAIIVTKMDGHAKGGGALSAVAASKSPIIFFGTGEHLDDLEPFDTKRFVTRLLGIRDLSNLKEAIEEKMPMEQQVGFLKNISGGNFTLRLYFEQIDNKDLEEILSKALQKMPHEKLQVRKSKYLSMMDSMTNAELDSPNGKLINNTSRILRVARGSGNSVEDVNEMLEQFKQRLKIIQQPQFQKILKQFGGLDLTSMKSRSNINFQQLSRMVPSHLLNQIGGLKALQGLMK